MVCREGHGLLVLTKSSDPVLVPAQLEKHHRQKALIYYWRINKPIRAYFLYDLAAVLKKQVPATSFRSSASLINRMILLLIKLFEEVKPCACTFALMDLTCMLLCLQRHRESKWTITEPPFLNKQHSQLTFDGVKYLYQVFKANQREHYSAF